MDRSIKKENKTMETYKFGKIENYRYNIREENPILVNNYPWGFKLKTQKRYWIEETKRGERFCTQTKNPKTGHWCTPKKSTYSEVTILCENKDGHISYVSIGKWDSIESIDNFLKKHKKNLSFSQMNRINYMRKAKTIVNDYYNDLEKAPVKEKIKGLKIGESKTVNRFYLAVSAVRKGCRKQKFECIELFEVDKNRQIKTDRLEKNALVKAKRIFRKASKEGKILSKEITIKRCDSKMFPLSESCMLFGERTIKSVSINI